MYGPSHTPAHWYGNVETGERQDRHRTEAGQEAGKREDTGMTETWHRQDRGRQRHDRDRTEAGQRQDRRQDRGKTETWRREDTGMTEAWHRQDRGRTEKGQRHERYRTEAGRGRTETGQGQDRGRTEAGQKVGQFTILVKVDWSQVFTAHATYTMHLDSQPKALKLNLVSGLLYHLLVVTPSSF